MRKITLTRGKVALVDDDMFDYLSQFKWCAFKAKNTYYAKRNSKDNHTFYMHIEILGKKEGFEIDHVDGNGLNNQRQNLRHLTHRQNLQNRHDNRASKYPGVSFFKQTNKWAACFYFNGKYIALGYFTDEYEAFLAYKRAVYLHTGQEVLGQ